MKSIVDGVTSLVCLASVYLVQSIERLHENTCRMFTTNTYESLEPIMSTLNSKDGWIQMHQLILLIGILSMLCFFWKFNSYYRSEGGQASWDEIVAYTRCRILFAIFHTSENCFRLSTLLMTAVGAFLMYIGSRQQRELQFIIATSSPCRRSLLYIFCSCVAVLYAVVIWQAESATILTDPIIRELFWYDAIQIMIGNLAELLEIIFKLWESLGTGSCYTTTSYQRSEKLLMFSWVGRVIFFLFQTMRVYSFSWPTCLVGIESLYNLYRNASECENHLINLYRTINMVELIRIRLPCATSQDISVFQTHECVICLQDLTVNTIKRLPCDHVLHEECLVQMALLCTGKLKCPTCRRPFIADELIASAIRTLAQDERSSVSASQLGNEAASNIQRAHAPFSVFAGQMFENHNGRHYVLTAYYATILIVGGLAKFIFLRIFSVERCHRFFSDEEENPSEALQEAVDTVILNMLKDAQSALPTVPREALLQDLMATGSLSRTIENALNGRLGPTYVPFGDAF